VYNHAPLGRARYFCLRSIFWLILLEIILHIYCKSRKQIKRKNHLELLIQEFNKINQNLHNIIVQLMKRCL